MIWFCYKKKKKSAANQEEGKFFFLTRKAQGWLSHMSLM